MAIDNQFRIGELISSGSRAIVSKDSITGNHTFTMGSAKVINTPYEHIKGERGGELTGRIEKPKYNEDELKKAVDTDVDELIGPPKKEKPPVVPKPLYDDLKRLYDERGVRINELESLISDLESEVETLKSELEALLIQVDALSLQTAAAQNEAQVTNDRYTLLLQDFSNAVVKSTKEGIERVSLKAQTEGLIAQKESLREQLKALNKIITVLEGTVATQQKQIEADIEREYLNSTIQDENNNFAYKIPAQNITDPSKGGIYNAWNKKGYVQKNGRQLVFYNFNETPVTVRVTKSGKDGTNKNSIKVPSSFTIGPGTGYNETLGKTATPGVTSIELGFDRPGGYKVSVGKSIRQNPVVNLIFDNGKGARVTVKTSFERDYKVQAKSSGNPNNKSFKVLQGTDVSE